MCFFTFIVSARCAQIHSTSLGLPQFLSCSNALSTWLQLSREGDEGRSVVAYVFCFVFVFHNTCLGRYFIFTHCENLKFWWHCEPHGGTGRSECVADFKKNLDKYFYTSHSVLPFAWYTKRFSCLVWKKDQRKGIKVQIRVFSSFKRALHSTISDISMWLWHCIVV